MPEREEHHGSSVPSGVSGLVQLGVKIVVALVRRPFIAPQWAWVLASVGFFVAAAVVAVVGPLVVAAVFMLAGAVSGVVWVQWWLLGRGDEPVVVVSPYASGTFAAREAAGTQLRSLHRFLTTDE